MEKLNLLLDDLYEAGLRRNRLLEARNFFLSLPNNRLRGDFVDVLQALMNMGVDDMTFLAEELEADLDESSENEGKAI